MITKNNLIAGSLVAIGMTTTFFVESSQAATVDPSCNETEIRRFNVTCGEFEGFREQVKKIPDKITTKTLESFAFGRIEDIPHDGSLPFKIDSKRKFQINATTLVTAASSLSVFSTMTDPFNPDPAAKDKVRLTTIWAKDERPLPPIVIIKTPSLLKASSLLRASSPLIPPNSLTGFDPDNPEIEPLEDEVFIDCFGMFYPATVSMTKRLDELSTFLPGFDLTAFGDNISMFPDTIVYVSQVELPASNIMCTPEPSALLSLLTLGLLGSGLTYKRKIQKSLIDSDQREATQV